MRMKTAILAGLMLLAGSLAFADTTTLRLGLTQPTTTFGDIWGAKLNNNAAIIDAGVAGQNLNNAFSGFNTFTSTITLFYGTPLQCLALDSGNNVITQQCSGGGSGSNALAIYNGFSTLITSPTPVMNFAPGRFKLSLAGAATAQIDLDPSTTYFIQNAPASQQTARINVSTGMIGNLTVSTFSVTSTATLTNATIAGPTLAYSSGTFLNSVAIGTTNVAGQSVRIIDTNGSGVGTFESAANQTQSWNIKNNTAGTAANLVNQVIGTGGDSATGAVAGDGEVKAANNLYFAAGGAAAKSALNINATSGVFISSVTASTETVTALNVGSTFIFGNAAPSDQMSLNRDGTNEDLNFYGGYTFFGLPEESNYARVRATETGLNTGSGSPGGALSLYSQNPNGPIKKMLTVAGGFGSNILANVSPEQIILGNGTQDNLVGLQTYNKLDLLFTGYSSTGTIEYQTVAAQFSVDKNFNFNGGITSPSFNVTSTSATVTGSGGLLVSNPSTTGIAAGVFSSSLPVNSTTMTVAISNLGTQGVGSVVGIDFNIPDTFTGVNKWGMQRYMLETQNSGGSGKWENFIQMQGNFRPFMSYDPAGFSDNGISDGSLTLGYQDSTGETGVLILVSTTSQSSLFVDRSGSFRITPPNISGVRTLDVNDPGTDGLTNTLRVRLNGTAHDLTLKWNDTGFGNPGSYLSVSDPTMFSSSVTVNGSFQGITTNTTVAPYDVTFGTSSASFQVSVSTQGGVGFFSVTVATLQQQTPFKTGEMFYLSNGTNALMCISTGTVKGAYASMQATNRTTACN